MIACELRAAWFALCFFLTPATSVRTAHARLTFDCELILSPRLVRISLHFADTQRKAALSITSFKMASRFLFTCRAPRYSVSITYS